MKIYALGPKGTNGHQVAEIASRLLQKHPYNFTGSLDIQFCDRNVDVFGAVIKHGDFGVVPIENSSEGLVGEVVKGFWLKNQTPKAVSVIAEINLPVRHCSLRHPKAVVLSEGVQVFSHSQAFGQCAEYLCQHNRYNQIPVSSTALAARMVAESKPPHDCMAIASLFAGKMYGLVTADVDIHDSPDNTTRFHVISRTEYLITPESSSRTAIIFETPDVPGALVSVLNTISGGGVNLSSIHSIPLGVPGKFAFYCEFDRHFFSREGSAILNRLNTLVSRLIVLGSFPQAQNGK